MKTPLSTRFFPVRYSSTLRIRSAVIHASQDLPGQVPQLTRGSGNLTKIYLALWTKSAPRPVKQMLGMEAIDVPLGLKYG